MEQEWMLCKELLVIITGLGKAEVKLTVGWHFIAALAVCFLVL